ncbi:MAG: hypothetical protein II814_01710 [Treponema sp.]|nr:hypothetical protein [Treponema sp.]
MKRLAIASALFLALAFLAAAEGKKAGRGGQTLFEPRHWIYDSLQILEQECAIVQFSDQAPLSLNQVRAMLGEIDYDSLSQAGKLQYDKIIGFFNEPYFSANASIFQVRVAPELNLEGFAKSNKAVPWVYDRYEKGRLIDLPVTLGVGDYATLFADIFLGLNKTGGEDAKTYFNIPYKEKIFDVNFPHMAYGSFGYAFTDTVGFNFRVDNMSQAFGRAQTSSVIQGGYLTDATNVSLSFYSPIAQYTGSLTQLNTRRYLYSHKVDARIGKKVQLSLMEAALPYGDMDLRFFNPMMFLHNYASWLDYQADGSDVGSFFGLKVNVAPVKSLRIYALWAMTQFQLPAEIDDNDKNKDNYVPNAMGVQGGLESYIPIKDGHLRLYAECSYTQPYLYINSSPNWSFVKTSSESTAGSSDFYEWVGSRYGPDTLAATCGAGYEVADKWKVGFKYLFLARGELSDPNIFKSVGWGPRIFNLSDAALRGWVYPFTTASDGTTQFSPKYKNGRNLSAPSGVPEYANVITLYGSYALNRWLSVMAQPSLAIVSNAGHKSGATEFSFECAFGIKVKFANVKANKAQAEVKDNEEKNAAGERPDNKERTESEE